MFFPIVVITAAIWVLFGALACVIWDRDDYKCERLGACHMLDFWVYGLLSFKKKYRKKICSKCFG